MDTIDTIEADGWTAAIHPDLDASSPEDWTTVGHLAYRTRQASHNAHELPHEDYDMADNLPADACVVLPVRAWDDRNGTELTIADGWHEADGWIYATDASVAETMGEAADRAMIAAALESELREWVKWAQGDVYGVTVTNPEGAEVDACWGFYGMDYAEEEARRMLDDARADAPAPPAPMTVGDRMRGTMGAALDAVDDALQVIREAGDIKVGRIIVAEGQLTVARSCIVAALAEVGEGEPGDD